MFGNNVVPGNTGREDVAVGDVAPGNAVSGNTGLGNTVLGNTGWRYETARS